MTQIPSVLLIGAGGIGSYFAGRPAANELIQVTAVIRHDGEFIWKHGIQVASIAGDFTFHPEIVNRPKEFTGHADWVMLCTKVLPDIDPVALLKPVVRPDTGILLIQNGIGMEEIIHRAFPHNPLLSAVAYIGVARTETPGRIKHTGGGTLKIGDYPTGSAPTVLREWVERFRSCGIGTDAAADIIQARWEKLLWNIPFNAISVVAGKVGTRWMVEDPELVELAERLMAEIQAVAASVGHTLTDAQIAHMIDYTRSFPDYKTSMLLDYEAGRPLECQAIVGNALTIARRNKVATPALQAVSALLASCDRANRQK